MTDYSKGALTEEISSSIKAVAINILNGVSVATPVDQGRARANWMVGVKTPDLSVSESTNFNATLSEGISKINGSGRDISTFYINNTLPYIVPLNEGSSTQAPAKFVETVLKREANR